MTISSCRAAPIYYVSALPPITVRVTRVDSNMSGITRGHSCLLCQRRKVRCDKQKPCGNCVKANAECTVVPLRPRGKRNTPKPRGRDLAERLKKYEELMTRHGLDFESLIDQGNPGAPGLPQNKVAPNDDPRNERPSRTTKERQVLDLG